MNKENLTKIIEIEKGTPFGFFLNKKKLLELMNKFLIQIILYSYLKLIEKWNLIQNNIEESMIFILEKKSMNIRP